jgi:stress-induced-phosphoprotein 1
LKEKDLGNEAYKKKDFVMAHKHYDKAIELEPTNVTFYNNKAGKNSQIQTPGYK